MLTAQIVIPLEWPSHVAISELVAEYWGDVGVKVDPRSYSIDLVVERLTTNDYDVSVWFLRRTNASKGYLPSNKFTSNDGWYATQWWAWHHSGGEQGEEPPPEFQEYFKLADQWYITADKAERDRIATQLFDFASEQVLLIGTVGYAPVPSRREQPLGQLSARRSVRRRRRAFPPRRQARPVVYQEPVGWRYDRLLAQGRDRPRAVPTGGGLGTVTGSGDYRCRRPARAGLLLVGAPEQR